MKGSVHMMKLIKYITGNKLSPLACVSDTRCVTTWWHHHGESVVYSA